MPTTRYLTANSKTSIQYDSEWLVLDVGSGHNPHPRANILVDRFIENDRHRSGQAVTLPSGKSFIVADASALPFRADTFDFVICSHVAEHIPESSLESFCSELNRVAKAGYIETPNVLTEYLRRSYAHLWFVSNENQNLVFRPIPDDFEPSWFGKLICSLSFYGTKHAEGYRYMFDFSRGIAKPWHYFLVALRKLLLITWVIFKPVFYTRLQWKDNFSWQVEKLSD